MGANGILQLKQPLLAPDSSAAQKNMRFDPYILNEPGADNFIDIDAQKLMFFILHAKPQGTDIAVGAADGDHIHWTNI